MLPENQLNLVERSRTSLLRWRGQFSPELIDLLLRTYADATTTVLDPFVGSGTTLLECGLRGVSAYGVDINSAAVYAARTAELINLPPVDRHKASIVVEEFLRRHLDPEITRDLFTSLDYSEAIEYRGTISAMFDRLASIRSNRNQETIFVNVLMQAMGDGVSLEPATLWHSFRSYQHIVSRLPFTSAPLRVMDEDARWLRGFDTMVDLIVTSPPYINVFNYHQNYRKAMELLGHQPLSAARSEVGANRKHRSNRFYTVVQYCLDMLLALQEMRRVLSSEGAVVIIIGRESSVRGQSFENGLAIYCLAIGGADFRLLRRHERVFTSRYGTRVYEDILVLCPNPVTQIHRDGFARRVAECLLVRALESAPADVKGDIKDALLRCEEIQASPPFRVPQADQIGFPAAGKACWKESGAGTAHTSVRD